MDVCATNIFDDSFLQSKIWWPAELLLTPLFCASTQSRPMIDLLQFFAARLNSILSTYIA